MARVSSPSVRLRRVDGLALRRWPMPSTFLLAALFLHVPALALAGRDAGAEPEIVAGICALLTASGAAALVTSNERVRVLGPALGLLLASACYAALTGRVMEGRLHALVVLAFAGVSRDPVVYGTSAAFALVSQVTAGLVAPVVPPPERGLTDTLFTAGFLAAAALAYALGWRAHPHGRDRSDTDATAALQATLREAERVKSELVSVVSHEFRTPLTSIRGFAQTLEQRVDRMDRATMMTCIRSIEGQARRLERIVANLLVASGDLRGDPDETVDVGRVVDAVVAELSAYPGVEACRIRTDVPTGLTVRAGAEATARVVENLLDNALKFGHPGTPVRVSARRAGDDVVLEIADLGPQIREHDLERIFHPFVQGDSSDSRRAEGIGLGLSNVAAIVAARGGRVEARNDPPEVVLVVTLPAAGPPCPGADGKLADLRVTLESPVEVGSS